MPMDRTLYPELHQLSTEEATELANLDGLIDLTYDRYAVEYTDIVKESERSRGSALNRKAMGGFGLPQFVASEFGGVHYDTNTQWPQQTFVYGTWSLGFIISRDLRDDDQWDEAGDRGRRFGMSWKMLPEFLVARMLNEGFALQTQTNIMNAGHRSPDGKALFATDHPVPGGGTFSNTNASGGIAMSPQGLRAMIVRMNSLKDDRGFPMKVPLHKVIVHTKLYPQALEVVRSTFKIGVFDRVKNVLADMADFTVMENHFISNTVAYYGFTSADRLPTEWIWRRKPERRMWKDMNTGAIHVAADCRFDFGWYIPYGVDADPGAGG